MILGIDQGTTGTTAVFINEKGRVLGRSTVPVKQFFPKPGWVEHDPEQIWKTVGKAVSSALRQSGKSTKKIRCVGITNQRETVSLFREKRPLHKFIVWQDRRTDEFCRGLQRYESAVSQKSGLPIDPYFSASKIRWLLDHLNLRENSSGLRFRTVESFLLQRLTGADVTEVTNASRTSLLSLRELKWSSDLFDIFGIPQNLAPEIIPSQFSNLKTKGLGFLPDGIPVCAALGDQQAALFGQMGWNAGEGKITFGTGSFILLNTGSAPVVSKNKLVSTVALQWENSQALYALEGSAFICGAWIQWLRDQLKLIKNSQEIELLAKKAKDSGGVLIIPALSGLGAPFWKAQARGAILGLTRGTSREQLALASLEALAFQNRALVDAMKLDSPSLSMNWKVDGGAVANNLLLQIQANILNTKIIRPKNLEATATGAALLAAHQQKLVDLESIQKTWRKDKEFVPNGLQSGLESRYQDWLKAAKSL